MTADEHDRVLAKQPIRKGHFIFHEGEVGDAAFIVETGTVGIFKNVDGEMVQLATLRDGEIFGEMAVIDGGKRMAAAQALTETVVIRVSKKALDAKLRQTDSFVRALLNILIRNLRNVHKIYMKRPRSIADIAKALSSFSNSLHDYINVIDVSDFSSEMAEKLAQLDKLVADLNDMAARAPDRRNSVIEPIDLKRPD